MTRTNRPLACLAMLFVLFWLFSWSVQARAAVSLAEGQSSLEITSALQYVQDESHQLQLAQVLALPTSQWMPNGNNIFSHGYTRSSWWLRFDVSNPRTDISRLLLELAYPVLDDVEVWVLGPGNIPEAHYHLGDKQAFHTRPVWHRFFLIPF